MTMQKEQREALYTITARLFKGLGDPIRLKIVEFLQDGERPVGEIVDHLSLPQTIS